MWTLVGVTVETEAFVGNPDNILAQRPRSLERQSGDVGDLTNEIDTPSFTRRPTIAWNAEDRCKSVRYFAYSGSAITGASVQQSLLALSSPTTWDQVTQLIKTGLDC